MLEEESSLNIDKFSGLESTTNDFMRTNTQMSPSFSVSTTIS